MSYVLNLVLSAIAVLLAAYLAPGVQVDGFIGALIVAVVLGLVNATLGAVLKLLTMPLNWLTLGLVGFIINVLVILFVDGLVTSFSTNGFRTAAIFALLLAVIQGVLGTRKAT